MRSRVLTSVLLLWASCIGISHAQSRADELIKLVQQDAFTITKCDEAGCKAVLEWRDRCVIPASKPPECPADGVKILQDVRKKLTDIAETPTQVGRAAVPLVNVLAVPRPLTAEVKTDFKEFQAEMDKLLDQQALWRIQPPARLEIDSTLVELDKALTADCAASQQTCDQAFGQAKGVATYATRISFVLTYFQRLSDGGLTTYYTFLDKKWSNYFESTRDQWPWELWINSARFRSEGLSGFREPPDSQVIVFHPSVGYEYGKGKFEESLQVELIGYYKWRWSDQGTVTDPKGASLTLNFSGREDSKRVGLGFLYHLKKGASIGLATRKQDAGGRITTIVFSYDLGKTVQDELKTVKEFVDGRK